MHVQFTLLVDSATLRPDGRLDATAIGPFSVQAVHFPTSVPEFAVVTRVGFDAGESDPGKLVVRVYAPTGEIVAQRESELEAPPIITTPTPDRTRTRVLNFFRVPVPVPGVYHVNIRLNDVDFLTRMGFTAEQVAAAATSNE